MTRTSLIILDSIKFNSLMKRAGNNSKQIPHCVRDDNPFNVVGVGGCSGEACLATATSPFLM